MKTDRIGKLEDFIKGYPNVETYLLARYKDYYLVKQPGHNMFYFMKGEDVLAREYISGDHLENLSIKYLNKKDEETLKSILNQKSYISFSKFIKDQTKEDYSYTL